MTTPTTDTPPPATADPPAGPGAQAPPLVDPIRAQAGADGTGTKVAIAGHPVHAMMVSFPIAMTMCTLGADGFYWWTGDEFWARAGLWSIGMAFLMGLAAGAVGTVELLMVPGIRARSASWTHFVIAVMLLSILGANWGLRLTGYVDAVLPYGLLLSLLGAGLTAFTGWHGGKLVFHHRLGGSATGIG